MAIARPGILLLALLIFSAQSQPQREPPVRSITRVLMIYSHDPNAPGVRGFVRELQGVLHTKWPHQIEVYDESLDFDRFGTRENWEQFAAYVASKYRGFPIDAVVAHGSMALLFAAERLPEVFPDVPIVYGAVFEPVVDFAALPSNVTGRRIDLPYAETFALARGLQPDAKRVVIVAGASVMDSLMAASAVRDVRPLLNGMQLEVLKHWSYGTLLQRLRDIPKQSIVILSAFRQDWHGQTFNSGDLIPSVTTAATVPVYGIVGNWVGDGIVGGTTMQLVPEGRRTGELLMQVLQQPHGSILPSQQVAENETVVDWRQLERWGLSEDRLPKGTQVLFRSPSAWQRYRTLILVVLAITAMQSMLIGLLTWERRRRIRAQRNVQEQAAYEKMLAALKTDAVRHAPDNPARALENAVARIGQYSGARSADLLVYADHTQQPSEIIRWTRKREAPRSALANTNGVGVVEISLVADEVQVGTLKLGGFPTGSGEGTPSRHRLEAAADLLAAALARARAARALAESRSHVAHIARVATMGQLGAAVTHELRQPLTAIRIHAETGALLLTQDPADVQEAREVFRDIADANARAVEIIEHVRMLLRRETGPMAPVSLNDICREAVKLLQRDAETQRVTIDFALASERPTIRGDGVQLQQVVINLVLNAIEAAATSARERRVIVYTAERGSQAELVVCDSGPGLPAQVEDHLFESFVSTKQNGLGMGLAIVRQIIELHHGEVHAEKAPLGGAAFRVTFPAVREPRMAFDENAVIANAIHAVRQG
jgi:C4-dicarboxylate-specific signal transduction histidine kinase